jgi:uncharacterized membrane protein
MKPFISLLRAYWLAFTFVLISLLLPAALYGRLPDPMPWMRNSDGTATQWMPRAWAALLLPLIQLLIFLFLVLAPTVDPGALRTRAAPRFYPFVVATICSFLTLTVGLLCAAALGAAPSVPHTLLGSAGLLVAVVGNYLGKVPRNYMVGIRTPWTLCNDYVWERTHRFAAPLFVCGPLSKPFVITTIAIVVLAPYCYSYVTWKRIRSTQMA